MGLFGALFAGVAGLGSQSNKIGIVSNNISNVNTVGYKQASAAFNTLVVPGASTGSFSPGGVLGNNRQLVSQQGLIQATTSNTDIAISGNGLFVVNTKPDGTGETLYTRSGSFAPDANGNFKNAAGFFLLGMTISDPQPEPNARLLTTVNVNPNATGSSVATSSVKLAANFNATQTPLQGAGQTATLVGDTTNANNSLSQILIPTTGTNGNNLTRGDSFTMSLNAGTNTYAFTYGGFNISRDVTSSTSIGDGGYALTTNSINTGVAIATTGSNITYATISNITIATAGSDATTSGDFSPGTLTFGTGPNAVSIPVTSGQTLTQIATALENALTARGTDAGSTVTVTGTSPFSLVVQDTLGSGTGFGGTSLAANPFGWTLAAQTITNIGITAAANSATENGGFTPGTLTYDAAGTPASIPITAGQSLNSIAAALQAQMRTRLGDTTSTVVVSGTGPFTLTVTDALAGAGGFTGTAVGGSTPAFTTGTPTTTPAANAVTTSALTNINVADSTTNGLPFGTGLFTDGQTLTIGGATTAALDLTTDSLADIATKIQTALQARIGDSLAGGSTATVTGNPGNYQITVLDKLNTGTGFSGTAIPAVPTFTNVAAVQSPTTGQITVTLASSVEAQKYIVGRTAYISGITGTLGNTATAAAVNGQNLRIVSVQGSTVTLALPSGITGAAGTALGGTNITLTNRTANFAGNMLDAQNDSDDFLGVTGATGFVNGATSFTATVNGTAYTFNYSSTPNTSLGQFNNLNTLVTAINTSSGGDITASIVNHKLYISATDTSKGISFTNGNAVGAGTGTAHQPGIDWVAELDLKNIEDAASGTFRFDSLQSLADQVNLADPTNIGATAGTRTVSLNAVDPQVSVEFLDSTANDGGSILQALGFKAAGGGNLSSNPLTMTGSGTGYRTGTLTGIYSASDPTKNMSSGAVTPQFSKDITIYDALGIGHTVTLNVAKLSSLRWAVEMTSVPASDVISANGTTANDGLISSGIVTFSGDGTLLGITGLGNGGASPIQINWTVAGGGATQSNITFNMGTIGLTDGFAQFAGSSNVSQAIQNGAPTGQLTGVSIDESGFVTASFSNGQTQKLYQIPLASVNNPNGLNAVSGNSYKQTLGSGEVSLNYAGTNGNGTLAASALEQSNVDLSTQLTDLIVAQQAYGANTRVLTVTSQLLQQLNQIIQ